MAGRPKSVDNKVFIEPLNKGTSIGRRNLKTSSMNKSKKRNYKVYRGQG